MSFDTFSRTVSSDPILDRGHIPRSYPNHSPCASKIGFSGL